MDHHRQNEYWPMQFRVLKQYYGSKSLPQSAQRPSSVREAIQFG